MDALSWQKLSRLLGLGVRARRVIVGVEQVRSAALRDKLKYAIVAEDASSHSRAKVLPLLAARKIEFAECSSALELGTAVGRATVTAAVGIIDGPLASGMRMIVREDTDRAMRRTG